MTFARTGRSMKNFEIIGGRRRPRPARASSAAARSSGRARPSAGRRRRRGRPAPMPEVMTRSSPTSWPISTVRCSTTSSLPATSSVASALVAAEGAVGHEQHVRLLRRAARARARNSPAAASRSALSNTAAHRERAGGGVDGRARHSRACPCADNRSRSASPTSTGIFFRSCDGDAALDHVGLDAQHFLLADVEVDVDRVELHDGRQRRTWPPGRPAGPSRPGGR